MLVGNKPPITLMARPDLFMTQSKYRTDTHYRGGGIELLSALRENAMNYEPTVLLLGYVKIRPSNAGVIFVCVLLGKAYKYYTFLPYTIYE